MKSLKAAAIFLPILAGTGCSTLMTDNNHKSMNYNSSVQSNHFLEQDEPTISIKPLPVEQQIKKGGKGGSRTLPITPIPASQMTAESTSSAIEIIAEPIEVEHRAQIWEIRKTDGTLFGALSRWAHEANYQLVFDTDGNDFPTDTEASFSGTFETAIADVMQGLQYSKYPLRVCLWDNKPRPVVKVLHKNKRCEG